jgi:enoyl-CoA hydratase/carnithine racemase
VGDGRVLVGRHGDVGHVAELVLDRPEALNALSTGFAARIAEAVDALTAETDSVAAADPSGRTGSSRVRAVVLSSSQAKAFCVGADLKQRHTFTDDDLRAQREVFRALANAFLRLPVPAVAAVEGYALGGGFELALLCDLAVAGADAVLALPEVSVGVVPGLGGTQLLTRRVGAARAGDLIYTTRRITAGQALALGAVDRVVPAGQARTVALELASTIAGNSPVGVRNAKRAILAGRDLPLAEGMDVEDAAWRATAFSPDRDEGVAAFVEKRPPVWSD